MNRAYVPVFGDGRGFRLYVAVGIPMPVGCDPAPQAMPDGIWGDARPAQIDDLVAAIKKLDPECQAYVARHLGLVPETVGERLEAAEDVLDAVSDCQLAIDRFRAYRKRFPEKRPEGDG